MQIAIYSRTTSGVDTSNLQQLLDRLAENRIEVVLYKPFYEAIRSGLRGHQNHSTFKEHDELHIGIDFLVSMGGDGTLLDSSSLVRNKGIPIIGINFGRLGFLSSMNKDDIDELVMSLIHNTYQIEERTLIHLDSNQKLFGNIPFGLNEFTIRKKDDSSMIKIHTLVDGEYLNTYWADGLIVSTPTGSTGYSLSCGGPIVSPKIGAFVITPIAPHNLNVRPILIPDRHIVSFETECRSDQFLCTLDSRIESVGNQTELSVRKEDFTIRLLRNKESSFLTTIRNKLLWGIDKRN